MPITDWLRTMSAPASWAMAPMILVILLGFTFPLFLYSIAPITFSPMFDSIYLTWSPVRYTTSSSVRPDSCLVFTRSLPHWHSSGVSNSSNEPLRMNLAFSPISAAIAKETSISVLPRGSPACAPLHMIPQLIALACAGFPKLWTLSMTLT